MPFTLTDNRGQVYVFSGDQEKLLAESLEKHQAARVLLLSAIIDTDSARIEKLACVAKLSDDNFLFYGQGKTEYLKKIDQEYRERAAALLTMMTATPASNKPETVATTAIAVTKAPCIGASNQ